MAELCKITMTKKVVHMATLLRSFARIGAIIICGLYLLLFLSVTVEHLLLHDTVYWRDAGSIVLIIILSLIVLRMVTVSRIVHSRYTFWVLLVLCLAVKLIWVINFRTVPKVDYLTFYKTAQMLATSWTIDFHYVALFPHILGYSSFLSLFFMIFGEGLLVAPVINTMLSVISMIFIYDITQRLWNRQAAVLASLIWIVYPSQTIYNSMVLSEPLYTTLILAFWAWMIRSQDKLAGYSYRQIVIGGIGAGLLLAAIDAVRPLGWVLFLALAIWLVWTLDWRERRERPESHGRQEGHQRREILVREGLLRKLLFLLLIATGLWTAGHVTEWYRDSRLGEQAASSVGYNIYVGFNEESRGRWNQADSDRLFDYVREYPEWTADDVQRQMFEDAKDRILHGNISFVSLFYDKLHLLWGDDAMAFKYSDLPKDETDYITVSNVFYIVTVFFSIIGLAFAVRKNGRSATLMLGLFMLGLTSAHLLSEVAYRYHYSGTAVFAILAGIGISILYMVPIPTKLSRFMQRLSRSKA